MIDKGSPIPIYHQLEELIKQQIDTDEISPEESILSEREFAEKFQISRMTVRQAITNLVNNGYLYRQKGKGTFVSKRKLSQGLQGVTSFSEEMLSKGFTPGSTLLEYKIIKADKRAAQYLQVPEETLLYKVDRIRLADDLPMAIETALIPCELVEGFTEELAKDSLYQYIEHTLPFKISEAYQELEAVTATEMEASYLQIEAKAPLLKIIRVTKLDNGKPFEYVKSLFRADRYKFTHILSR